MVVRLWVWDNRHAASEGWPTIPCPEGRNDSTYSPFIQGGSVLLKHVINFAFSFRYYSNRSSSDRRCRWQSDGSCEVGSDSGSVNVPAGDVQLTDTELSLIMSELPFTARRNVAHCISYNISVRPPVLLSVHLSVILHCVSKKFPPLNSL